MSRPFFVDTDTASDDAVALVMALRHPDVEVVGIGVVAGNVPLDLAVQNALFVVDECAAATPRGLRPRTPSASGSLALARPPGAYGAVGVPVYAGADRPLVLPLETGQYVHGQDGMGDIGLPLGGRQPAAGHAVDAMLAASRRYAGELTLVTLGPLTNIAMALRRDPGLTSRISRCVVMGAVADHVGNQNPVAEFNMWVDPHAVDVVLQSGLPLELVGWDISRRYAVIEPAEATELRGLGTRIAEWCVDIQRCLIDFCAEQTKLGGYDLPDPIAMAFAIDPSIATDSRRLHCAVETTSALTRGMVVMDLLGFGGREPNALVVTAADRDRFMTMLRAAMS